jgi:hypothetical protein
MFDPAKLSPLPIEIKPWHSGSTAVVSENARVVAIMPPDDAEFFLMSRRCYDIGERREWHVAHDRFGWMVQGTNFGKQVGIRFRMRRSTQAEAMGLMVEADEWLTSKEKDGAK